MQKAEQNSFLFEVAVANKDLILEDNKVKARFDWLKQWDKNPRTIQKQNLEKLKKQIQELSLYKPLVVYLENNNAIILGGNMRYQAIKELKENDKTGRYDYTWVSVVNADNDIDKMKYAISDNFSAGEYTRDKLVEILKLEQPSLFENYDVEFTQKTAIKDFLEDIAMSDVEFKMKGLKKELKNLGINNETLDIIESMAVHNKITEKLEEVDLLGKIEGQKYPIIFWFDDEVTYEQIHKIFATGKKNQEDTSKLLEYTEKCLGVKFPTTIDIMEKIMNSYPKLDEEEKFRNEIGEKTEDVKQKKQILIEEFKRFYKKLSLDEGSGQESN